MIKVPLLKKFGCNFFSTDISSENEPDIKDINTNQIDEEILI